VSEYNKWFQGAIVYQIYPRSFYDAKGSGIGNLRGIIDKLDYLGGTPESLGVTALWISPIYASPMADFGYDVADYCAIDPIFGNLDDLKTLLHEAHKRSIKVILDFVPNHTSDEHPWFIEASSSRDNPKRDWYVWQDKNLEQSDGQPNNWLSVFGGSAWQWSAVTNQYFLHSFLAKQPDLNWDNPEVREAIKSIMRFWLDLGVDGFRVDAVDWLSKDRQLRDDPTDTSAINKVAGYDHESLRHTYSRDGPHLFSRLNEMAGVLDEYEDRFMITEAHPETEDKVSGYVNYYQGVNPHLSAPFNFEGIYLPWDASAFRNFVDSFQTAMKPRYTPIYTVGNHDEPRIASRIGPAAARTAALMLLSLPGMAFIYYGEELGMADVKIPKNRIQDPFARPGQGRDPQRTPMQWDNSPQAGFTTGTPWLPVSPDYKEMNVQRESQDTTSSLTLYKRLIAYRNNSLVLKHGDYKAFDINEHIFSYKRLYKGEEILVLLNFSNTVQNISVPDLSGVIELSTQLDRDEETVNNTIKLRANEGLLIRVSHD
jgi:alpha-glucosidase